MSRTAIDGGILPEPWMLDTDELEGVRALG
jgi:hypothetical protein